MPKATESRNLSPFQRSRIESASNSSQSNLVKKVDYSQGKSDNNPQKIQWDGSLVNIDPYRAGNSFRHSVQPNQDRKFMSEVYSKPKESLKRLPSHTSID